MDLDSCPEYHALSYTWGNPKDTNLIDVNRHAMLVTSNLYTALRHLRQLGKPNYDGTKSIADLTFWVDAICINQQDVKEKSDQVPRMKDIYCSAESVICWLGLASTGDEEMIGKIFAMARSLFLLELEDTVSALRENVQDGFQKFRETLKLILCRPWFSRVWVAQEVVLPTSSPNLFLGMKSASLKELTDLVVVVYNIEYNVDFVCLLSEALAYQRMRDCWRDKTIGPRTKDIRPEEKFAQDLVKFLEASTVALHFTVPHDIIYSGLGLCMPTVMPEKLKPDYSIPFSNILYYYISFLIKQTGDLRLLACVQRENLIGVPSWVPDMRYCNFNMWDSWRGRLSDVGGDVVFSENDNVMKAKGVSLGPCFPITNVMNITVPDYLESQVQDPSELLCNFFPQKVPASNPYWMEVGASLLSSWVRYLMIAYTGYSNINIQTLLETSDRYLNLTPEKSWDGLSDGPVTAAARQVLRSAISPAEYKQFFAVLDGTVLWIMQSDAENKIGDVVCVLKGSESHSLLHRSEGRYHFISSAKVVPISTSTPSSYDQKFFDSHEVIDIYIV